MKQCVCHASRFSSGTRYCARAVILYSDTISPRATKIPSLQALSVTIYGRARHISWGNGKAARAKASRICRPSGSNATQSPRLTTMSDTTKDRFASGSACIGVSLPGMQDSAALNAASLAAHRCSSPSMSRACVSSALVKRDANAAKRGRGYSISIPRPYFSPSGPRAMAACVRE